jgi:uncharacterized protein YfaS (alpha-2-macroglobulin family)
MQSDGIFLPLKHDTTFSLNFSSSEGELNIYAQGDAMDVLLDEITFLKTYPYECNEQLASRLKALLLEKQIAKYKDVKFKDENAIGKAIRKLAAHQNKDGGWSWWKTGEGEMWITLHVAKSLMLAENEGYHVPYDIELLMDYLAGGLVEQSLNARLLVYKFLLENGQAVRIRDVADSLKRSKLSGLHEKLMAGRLLQLSGEKVDREWINSLRSETIKGNYYWGENRNNLTDNAVFNTILVYEMIEKENPDDKMLASIRDYFLEQRKATWRNTYESASILEAILPALLKQKNRNNKIKLAFTGDINQTIEKFPFKLTTNEKSFTVTKTGEFPVYFTAYQQTWNANPEKTDKDFKVQTSFENNVTSLRAGKPVRLNVTVEVKKDAEYVMIEVPVPAGCSYQSKTQPATDGEVHREYYYHKANIFCKYLKRGVYHYAIELLPRYSGTYTLNPARVECMYFPTLYGSEETRTIQIK